jgi:excisionase family DNA binding protein
MVSGAGTIPKFSIAERAMNPMESDNEILTVKEVSDLLQVHPSTLYKLSRQGKIPSFKIGSDWRFRKDEIVRWMVGDESGTVEMSEVAAPLSKSEHRSFEPKPLVRQ